MWTVLALTLLAADPEPPAEPANLAVFTAPIGPVVAAVWGMSASRGTPIVFVPLGVAFTVGDTDWMADVAFQRQEAGPGPFRSRSLNALGHTGTWLSLGPSFHSGPRALNGFFFSPKLTLGLFLADDVLLGTVLIGFDTGYQVTFGPLYLAFLFGASLGLGVNDTDSWAGPLTNLIDDLPARNARGVFGLNVQLFRLGYVF